MAFIANKSELESAKELYVNYIESEIEHASLLIDSIQNFRNSTEAGELLGRMWADTSEKMNVYAFANRMRKEKLSAFKDAIASGLNKLIGAWDADFGEEVSDVKLEELEREIKELLEKIDELSKNLTRTEERTNSEGKKYYVSVVNEEVKHALDEAVAIKNELKKIVNKIKVYKELHEKIMSDLGAAYEGMNGFYSPASKITPTPVWSYESYMGYRG